MTNTVGTAMMYPLKYDFPQVSTRDKNGAEIPSMEMVATLEIIKSIKAGIIIAKSMRLAIGFFQNGFLPFLIIYPTNFATYGKTINADGNPTIKPLM